MLRTLTKSEQKKQPRPKPAKPARKPTEAPKPSRIGESEGGAAMVPILDRPWPFPKRFS
jgi:hypothetical protein